MFMFHYSLPWDVRSEEESAGHFLTRGEIYIETDEGNFPCIGWNDRLLSVLSLWMGSMMVLLDPERGEQTVRHHFMNGPYFFDIQNTEEERINIRFMRRGADGEEREEMPSVSIAFADYRDALLHLVEAVIHDPGFQRLEDEPTRSRFEQSVARLRTLLETRS